MTPSNVTFMDWRYNKKYDSLWANQYESNYTIGLVINYILYSYFSLISCDNYPVSQDAA